MNPLANLIRPVTISDFVGQSHLLAPGKPFHQLLVKKKLHSMILWGPPGTGKTTLARLLAENITANFVTISAVLTGIKEIKTLAESSITNTVIFVDEIHRFNKAQQDAFLPWVENGRLTLIGATTENPSFELNNALLSRARVYLLKALTTTEIVQILKRALTFLPPLPLKDQELTQIAEFSNGDARQAINFVEIYQNFADQHSSASFQELLREVLHAPAFDKQGEWFYDLISALHKAIRGSDPDAALYWFARMIKGGCPPLYIARRLIRLASEDIGNADLNALTLTLNAANAFERLGSPEGELALAQAVLYLAVAPKSNACYLAYNRVQQDLQTDYPVPLHLRNAPTQLMKQLDYGKHYRYPHDTTNAYIPNEQYFPDHFPPRKYYQPVERGLEIKIKAKLAMLKQLEKGTTENSP